MKHSRILLIDHDGEDIESVTHSLINLGIGSTVVARSEYEALDDIKNRNPELIIMNITESGLNRSLVLARQIRSGHNKPILYLAPNSEKSSLIKANLLTSNNYLLKPFIGTDLRNAVEYALTNMESRDVKVKGQKEFLNALKSMSDGLISTDIVGNVTYMNPAAESLTGWKLSEAKRMALQDVFSVNNISGKELSIEFNSQETNHSVQNFFLSNKQGEELSIQNSAAPLKDQDGSLVGIVVVFREFTGTDYFSESQHDESVAPIKKIIDGLANPLLLVNQNWGVTFANNSAINFFDIKNDHLVAFNLLELFSPPLSEECIANAELSMSNRKEFRFDFFYDIENCWYEMSGHPYGEGMLIQLTDVTIRIEESANELRAERLESLGLMARGFAHDFNNLLTVILGNLSLANVKLPKGIDGFGEVENALTGTIRAQNRIQQLLTFAKGGVPIKQNVDLSKIVSELIKDIESNDRIHFECDLPDELWKIEADPGQIRRVFENLIKNSQEALTEGGKISVKIRNYGQDSDYSQLLPSSLDFDPSFNYVLIEISDDGPGISANESQKIFEPFYTSKSSANATGIGLTVCSSIVEAHQGSIGIHSEIGAGTSVYVVFPALVSTKEIDDTRINDSQILSTPDILILEDDVLIRQLLVANLKKEGYSVSETEEGSETVSAYVSRFKSGKPYDLIIMDLSIPNGMGGVEAIEEIRRVDPNVVAIVSSGYSDDPVMSDPESYGFNAVLPKPYKPQELNSLVKNLLKK